MQKPYNDVCMKMLLFIMFFSPMLRKCYYLLCMWALALGPYAGGAGGAAPRWCCLICPSTV